MKNLLVYANPNNEFDPERQILVKLQVDNSLELGWKPEDILLVTNFPYNYRGIQATVFDKDDFHTLQRYALKIVLLANLVKSNFFTDKEVYWYHDFDAYQLEPFTPDEPNLDKADMGLTTYGWMSYWCTGSVFFKKSGGDIFERMRQLLEEYKTTDDEWVLRHLTRIDTSIRKRIKELDITYDFGMRHIDINYQKAQKPIKVLHFHPWYKGNVNTLDVFLHGKNELKMPLVNPRLLKIFNHYGIQ